MNLYTRVQQSVQLQYEKFLEYSKKPYMKESFLVIGVTVAIAAVYFGFDWYQKRKNTQAFAALMEISKSYEQAASKAEQLKDKPSEEQTENPWEDTQLLLEALTSANSGSSLAPFFILYQAQLALQVEGDYDQACQLMEKAVKGLSKKSVYYDMFNLKRLKMLLDSPMEHVRVQALQELQAMADNPQNYYGQQALYVIGSYQAYHGNIDAAVQAWKKIAEQDQSENALISLPWVTQAQETLKTLNIAVE